MISTVLIAAALTYSGTFGQSAAPGEEPVKLFGINTAGESPDGHVYFADPQALYTVDRDKLIGPVCSISFCSPNLSSDGESLWVLCEANYSFQRLGIDPKTGKFKVVENIKNPMANQGQGGPAVRPADPKHPFAKVGKFFAINAKTRKIVAIDEKGQNPKDFADFPNVGLASGVEGLGFLPETGQLCAVTGFPDTRIYRFNPDGTRDDTAGWPIHRGYGRLPVRGGILYHTSHNGMHEVHRQYTAASTKETVVKPDSIGGFAVDAHTGYRYVATTQGILFARPGETEFRHRIGGVPRPTSILLDHGELFFCNGRVGMFRLNDGPDSPLAGQNDLRNMYSWTDVATALSPFADRYIAAIGKKGIARFTYRWHPDNKQNHPKFNDFVITPELPKFKRANAVSADTLTREIFFAADDLLFRADYPVVEPKVLKVPLEVRQVKSPVAGEIRHLARPTAAPSVGFCTTNAFGAFAAANAKPVWKKDSAAEVRGIAAVDRKTFVVTTADAVTLYAAADGKKLGELDLKGVPGGIDPDLAAAEYPWVVVYDRKNFRFVRLAVNLKKGN